MGLGPYPLVSLSEARDKATAQRRLLLDGIDPIAARDAKQPVRDPITLGPRRSNASPGIRKAGDRRITPDNGATHWIATLCQQSESGRSAPSILTTC